MPAGSSVDAPNVVVSSDRLTVTLKACADDGQLFSPAELIAQLGDLGIKISDPGSIENLAGDDGKIRAKQDLVLVRGTAPIPAQPARRELLVQPPAADAVASHYERAAYLTAHPEQQIARIYPPVPGQDGTDVFGDPLAHTRAKPSPFVLGENVEFESDGITVRATALGRIYLNEKKIWVSTVAEIPGDVDFSCGNIDVSGDVEIKGSVLDLFKVNGCSIHVGGAVEAAQLTAAHDLRVEGGIIGKDKGHCSAGANVFCKYATNVTLVAGADIHCRGEIAHARVICTGRLTLDAGPLSSGHISANGGVSCQSLGSPSGSKVLVEAGFDEQIRSSAGAKIQEICSRKLRAARIRSMIAQIAQVSRGVNDAQRQRAALLLREADETEKIAEEMFQPLRDLCLASREKRCAQVIVQDLLHAGAVIRFPHVEATIDIDWKGPLRLVPRQHKDEWEVLLIDSESNSTRILASRQWRDSVIEALERILSL